jgi:hypothetical protein
MLSGLLSVQAGGPLIAYVGPGIGVGLLAALVGVLAALGSALLFVILWPLRLWRRKARQRAGTDANSHGKSPAEAKTASTDPTRADR